MRHFTFAGIILLLLYNSAFACEVKDASLDDLWVQPTGTIAVRVEGSSQGKIKILPNCSEAQLSITENTNKLEFFLNTSNYCDQFSDCERSSVENALYAVVTIINNPESFSNLRFGEYYRNSGWVPKGNRVIGRFGSSAKFKAERRGDPIYNKDDWVRFIESQSELVSLHEFEARIDRYFYAVTPIRKFESWLERDSFQDLMPAFCKNAEPSCTHKLRLLKFQTTMMGAPTSPTRFEANISLARDLYVAVRSFPEQIYNKRIRIRLEIPRPTARPSAE